tara:strand:- start:116 stop:742 length:627 start_codon:yes stop_codon:yes gene_type:complete
MTQIFTKTQIFIKRINKEIEDITTNKYSSFYSDGINKFFNNLKFSINPVEYFKNNKYYLQILKNNNFYFELNVPCDYPFRPYNICKHLFSTNYSYISYLGTLTRSIKSLDENVLYFFYVINYLQYPKFINSNDICYCCSSLLCFKNWCVSSKLSELLLEFHEIEFITNYIKNNELYKEHKIIYNDLFENHFNKLPDEIIYKILNYVTF